MIFWSLLVQILQDLEIWEIIERNVPGATSPYSKNQPYAKHIIKNKEKINEEEVGGKRRREERERERKR